MIFEPFVLLLLSVPGDEVVPYKHGEKSIQVLSSAGFRCLTFKSYDGYLKLSMKKKKKKVKTCISNCWNALCAGLGITQCLRRWTRFAIG